MGSVLAAAYVAVVLLVLAALAVFLKRHVLSRHPLPTAAQQAGLAAMALLQTPEQRSAVEELEYTKKDWADEARHGEGPEAHGPGGDAPRPDGDHIDRPRAR